MTSKYLSVVVPVHNLAADVEHLETELSKLDRSEVEIILVDDSSTDGTASVLKNLKAVWDDIVVIRTPSNLGAGGARNLGFPLASGSYTLFFDSDDFLHPEEIFETAAILEESGADASINVYDFIRDGSDVTTGMNMIDHDIWGTHSSQLSGRTFHIREAPKFLRFTNFPWNKMIRTAHYQSLNLAPFFGETKVNNDILGHWNILLNARKIVMVDRKIVTHRMSGARDHLSKRFGAERLEIFSALRALHDLLKTDPGGLAQFGATYWSFAMQMTNWAGARLDDQFQTAFRASCRDLVRGASLPEVCDVMEAREKDTYRWLMDLMD